MRTKSILFFLLAIVALSCKDDKKENIDNVGTPPAEEVSKGFVVTLNVILKKDDDFSLFYSEDGSLNFNDPIWVGVKGRDGEQAVAFNLPEDVFPTELRLDLGLKKDQEDVVLKSVTFSYKGKQRVIIGAELGFFFRADDSKCTFDPVTGVIKGIEKNGVKAPSLYPHEVNLKAELEKLAN